MPPSTIKGHGWFDVELSTVDASPGTVTLEEMSVVYAGSMVGSGVTLHTGAMLAGNSFANKDIAPWEIWGGSPARKLKDRDSATLQELLDNFRNKHYGK